jgi:hypothetical protein
MISPINTCELAAGIDHTRLRIFAHDRQDMPKLEEEGHGVHVHFQLS